MRKIKFIIKDIKLDHVYSEDCLYLQTKYFESFNPTITIGQGPRYLGKSYGTKLKMLKKSYKNNKKFVYITYTKSQIDELVSNNGEKFFSKFIEELSKEYDKSGSKTADYWLNLFKSSKVEGLESTEKIKGKKATCIINGRIMLNNKHVGYIYSLNDFSNLKSNDFTSDYKYIFLDEFSREKMDISDMDNAKKFHNLISTIGRDRKDLKIYMMGNSVNQFCPMLDAFKVDDLPLGYMRLIYKENDLSRPYILAYRIDPETYPGYIKRMEESDEYALGCLINDTSLNDNQYSNLIDRKLIITGKESKSKTTYIIRDKITFKVRTICGSDILLVYKNFDNKEYKRYICFNKQYINNNTVFNNLYKDLFISKIQKGKIKFQDVDTYARFMDALGLKLT